MQEFQLIRSCFWAVLCGVLLTAGWAQALPVSSTSLGSGRGCADFACADQRLTLSSSAAGTGSFTLSATMLTFNITLPSSVFVPIVGADDNGVTQLELSNVTYIGSATVFTAGMLTSITGGSATVEGFQTPSGAGTPGPFSFSDSLLSGQCFSLGIDVSCGIVLSSLNDSNFDVNGQTRHFTQTLNLTATPEPSTAILVAAGLACLATRRPRVDRVR